MCGRCHYASRVEVAQRNSTLIGTIASVPPPAAALRATLWCKVAAQGLRSSWDLTFSIHPEQIKAIVAGEIQVPGVDARARAARLLTDIVRRTNSSLYVRY